jgi:predicted RNase H-like HicB family nuclease
MNRAKFDLDAYPFQIRSLSKDDGGGFLIEYPDVPGCTSDGGTPEEAMKNGRDALRSALRTLREFGRSRSAARFVWCFERAVAAEGSEESSRAASGSRRTGGRQSRYPGDSIAGGGIRGTAIARKLDESTAAKASCVLRGDGDARRALLPRGEARRATGLACRRSGGRWR